MPADDGRGRVGALAACLDRDSVFGKLAIRLGELTSQRDRHLFVTRPRLLSRSELIRGLLDAGGLEDAGEPPIQARHDAVFADAELSGWLTLLASRAALLAVVMLPKNRNSLTLDRIHR